MDEALEAGARTKTLAVFENVITKEPKRKRKYRASRYSDDDWSPSESELVIDDEVKTKLMPQQKAKVQKVNIKEEVLALKCEWDDCLWLFGTFQSLNEHLICHAEEEEEEDLSCHWSGCPCPRNIPDFETLTRHISYHAYLAKLINVGENVLKRNSLPDCLLPKNYTVDTPHKYICEWGNCNLEFNTIWQQLEHVDSHLTEVPTGKRVGFSEIISCKWSGKVKQHCCKSYITQCFLKTAGCGARLPTRYKLAIHLRVHTKERIVACPTCVSLFASKGAFCEHRRRQLSVDLRSYQCSQCLKLFSGKRLLSDHMRSHINQYKCSICDMTSPKPSMLARHYRFRHMDIKMFSCHLCSKTFVTNGNLAGHLLTHKEKPFKCDQCEFGCKSKVGLKNHMIKVHGLESLAYECEVCKLKYKRGDYLTYHLMRFHKFHWPSGHCRFRYRKDADGVHRLQTVRYESLEVTEEVIRSESMPTTKNPSAVTYQVTYDKDSGGEYNLTILEGQNEGIEIEPVRLYCPENGKLFENEDGRPIIITIEDIDEMGNILKITELDSKELCLSNNDRLFGRKEIRSSRDMPVVDTIVKDQ